MTPPRVISLVPSLTETLFALGVPKESVVGRTAWCIHPAEQVSSVPILGGTKTPNLRRIHALAPDLVLLEKEENPLSVYEALLAAGIPTGVTHVTRVTDVPPMLESLGAALQRLQDGVRLAELLRTELLAKDAIDEVGKEAGPAAPFPRALPLIWHEPLMTISPARYGGDLLRRAGFDIPDADPRSGYPEISPARIRALGITYLLLSSEPHDFSIEEGEAIATQVEAEGHVRPRVVKIDGEALTWFGSRTAAGLRALRTVREQLG